MPPDEDAGTRRSANLVDDVDCDGWRDRVGGVAAGGEQARAQDYADAAVEVVFDGGSQAELPAGTGIQPDRLRWIRDVVSRDRRVGLIAISGIERQHPAVREAVFPGGVDQDGSAGPGVSAKTFNCAVDAGVFNVDRARKGGSKVEAHAQDAAFGHPEKCLRIEAERGGEGSGAEAVARPREAVVLAGRERFLNIDGRGGNPAAFVKQMQAVLRLYGEIADADSRAAGAVARLGNRRWESCRR